MGATFRCKWGEHSNAENFGRTFQIVHQPDTKTIDCHANLINKVTQKLTYLSSPSSLRNIFGELGDPKMAPSFPIYVISLSLQTHGENTFMHFLHILRGAPMSHR